MFQLNVLKNELCIINLHNQATATRTAQYIDQMNQNILKGVPSYYSMVINKFAVHVYF